MRQYNCWLLTGDPCSDTCWCESRQSASSSNLWETGGCTTPITLMCSLTCTPSDVHAGCAAFRRYVELHFADIDVRLILSFAFFLAIGLADLFLAAHFVYFVDKGVAQ